MKDLPYPAILGAVKDRLSRASAGVDATLGDAVVFDVGEPGKDDSTELHERIIHRGVDSDEIAAIQAELGGRVDPVLYAKALEVASRAYVRQTAERGGWDISKHGV